MQINADLPPDFYNYQVTTELLREVAELARPRRAHHSVTTQDLPLASPIVFPAPPGKGLYRVDAELLEAGQDSRYLPLRVLDA